MGEKSNYKKACILIDENDLAAFRGLYRNILPEEFSWFPVTFSPIMHLMWEEERPGERRCFPQVGDKRGCSFVAKGIYEESQKFLKELCLANNIVTSPGDYFPLEYFWLGIWVGAYRIIAFCSDLLNRFPVEEVILIERNKLANEGGLLIDMGSFAGLVKEFFENRNIKVRCLSHKDIRQTRPRTIFYDQRYGSKIFLHQLKFIYWKLLSFNRKNYDYILIRPGYDNTVGYNKIYSSRILFPQIFHGKEMPFLHSWSRLFRLLIRAAIFRKEFYCYNTPIIESYRCKFFDFEFDFTKNFHSTIIQYLNDVKWMQGYIHLFWRTCMDNHRKYLAIFSSSPVHLHSYFLIKKIKETEGKVAVWQHGGFYGYTDHFLQYVSDYKSADYFLSLGRNEFGSVTGFNEGDSPLVCVQIGSNMFNNRLISGSLKRNNVSVSYTGLFIPAVIGTFYSQARVKWNATLQFEAVKQIIDFFGQDAEVKLIVKGLKGHKAHLELNRYIERRNYSSVSYIDIPIQKALLTNPNFIILDSPSTALLEVLAHYRGGVFLMVNQESWLIKEDALNLLKKRVVYSQSVDELKLQLADFLKTGLLHGIDTHDRSFVDTYIKQFSYHAYEQFLEEATQRCQS